MSSFWLLLLSAVSTWTLVVGNMENVLINDLLKDYSKNARPVNKTSDAMNLTLSLDYISLDLDDTNQIQTIISYLSLRWKDKHLVWDPAVYDGIKHVFIDNKYLWVPDISLYNSAGDTDAQYAQGVAMVSHDGSVILIRTMKAKVYCGFDSLQFPFDTATCLMKFGSWVYSSLQMNLIVDPLKVDMSGYRMNPTWEIYNVTVERRADIYACCPETYYTAEYTNKFLRRSTHYVQVLFTPTFFLSILTILLFALPVHSSERVTLGILLFAAFFMILLFTSSIVTTWYTIPYFCVFLIFNLIMITLVTLLNSLIVQLSNSESKQEVPKILRTIMFEFLAKLFCMKSILKRNRSRHLVSPEYELPTPSEKEPITKTDSAETPSEVEVPASGKQSLEMDVAFIRAFIRSCWQKKKDADEEKKFSNEWKDVARVLNRLLFVLYVPIVAIAIGAVLIQISAN